MLNRVFSKLWVLKYILPTIYFNFHYLPFRQAIYLPIFLYKPNFIKTKGRIVISGGVRPGMIVLGRYFVSIFPNNGIVIDNSGVIEFHGRCAIGNNSYLSVGSKGHLIFGDNFACSTTLKLVCHWNICFGYNVHVGWDNLFMDTDFHKMKYVDGRPSPKSYGSIYIDDECWLGSKNIVMKNTKLPKQCTVATNSMLNKKYDCPKKSLLAGQPAKVIKSGIYRDFEDDIIEYGN